MTTNRPAKLGTLSADVLRDLVTYREFLVRRDAAMAILLGKRMPPTRLRDELLRSVIVEFGYDRRNRLSFYQRTLEPFAGRFAVRDEVHRLSNIGVLILENDPTDRRSLIVHPTEWLIDWCEDQTRLLKFEIKRMFSNNL